MDATLDIHPTDRTNEGFAPLNLVETGGHRLCQVDVQYSRLAALPSPNPRAVDFLVIAAAIYALDKVCRRDLATDAWTRELTLRVPVSDPAAWRTVGADLNECLSFLTGDDWTVLFSEPSTNPVRPFPPRRHRAVVLAPSGDAVSLFSGGLDSLIGVVDWLEQSPARNLLLVGHHDSQVPGPFTDQKALREPLRQEYSGRVKSVLVRVGPSHELVDEAEITLRGRSLIFIALGMFAASSLGPDVPLLIPENGTIALNVPLTPSRRGSCSTRTAHPHYLTILGRVLNQVGLTNKLSNPLESKTKGEAVMQCKNAAFLNAVCRLAVSCAKRNRRGHWRRRQAKSCGYCMPCVYRRAAMHTLGLDDEVYGLDVCTGEVDLADSGDTPNDLRACLSFLNRNVSVAEIGKLLMANGSVDPSQLAAHAATVGRTMDEIRSLFRSKANPEMKRLAGVH